MTSFDIISTTKIEKVQGSPGSPDLTWTGPHFDEHYKKSKNEISSREYFSQ